MCAWPLPPNDERTAKRLSDALGTATELRSLENLSGKRSSLWLSNLSVSKQETPRPLLTPGEVMQLPRDDALVLVSSLPPIRARKLKYFVDSNFMGRALAAPKLGNGTFADLPPARPNPWKRCFSPVDRRLETGLIQTAAADDPDDPRPLMRELKKKKLPDRQLDLPLASQSHEGPDLASSDGASPENDTLDPVITFPGGVRV